MTPAGGFSEGLYIWNGSGWQQFVAATPAPAPISVAINQANSRIKDCAWWTDVNSWTNVNSVRALPKDDAERVYWLQSGDVLAGYLYAPNHIAGPLGMVGSFWLADFDIYDHEEKTYMIKTAFFHHLAGMGISQSVSTNMANGTLSVRCIKSN